MGVFRSRGAALAASTFLVIATIGLVDAQQRFNRNRKAAVPIVQSPEGMMSAPLSLGTARPVQTKVLGAASFNPARLTVATQAKIVFRPKLKTSTGDSKGQPLDPNLKVSIAGGKQANASDLVDGTNGLEQTLNDLGYSLYTRENDATTPIVTLNSSYANLSAQASDLRQLGGMRGSSPVATSRDVSAELVTFTTKTPTVKTTVPGATTIKSPATAGGGKTASVAPVSEPAPTGGKKRRKGAAAPTSSSQSAAGSTVKRSNKSVLTPTTATLSPSVATPPPNFSTIDKSVTLFDKTYGDPDWFAIDFNSKLTKHADMKLRKVTANADIKATIIGKSITLFHAKVEAGGKKNYETESMNVSPTAPPRLGGPRRNQGGGSTASTSDNQAIRVLEATCLGDDLISPVNRSDSGKSRQKIDAKSVNWEYSVKIPIIPAVNAVGTIGAKGSLGVTLMADADSADGEIKIVPSINTSIYAQVGIAVGFAVVSVEGGVGAELTLLDYNLTISAGVGVTRTNIGDKTYIAAATPIEVTHNFNTLSGKLYGYAKVSYWLPFKTHEKTLWNGNLIKWDGFTDSRTLYEENSDAVILGESNIPMKTIAKPGGG